MDNSIYIGTFSSCLKISVGSHIIMKLAFEDSQTHRANVGLLKGREEGEGWRGNLGLADAN